MLQNKGTRHAGTQQSWASPSRTTCAPPCATAGRARRAPCEDGPRPSCPRPRSRCATRAASSRVLQTAEAALRASCTSRTPMAEMVAPPQGSDVFENHPRSQFGPIFFIGSLPPLSALGVTKPQLNCLGITLTPCPDHRPAPGAQGSCLHAPRRASAGRGAPSVVRGHRARERAAGAPVGQRGWRVE